jgi:hypothetical protein
MAMVNRGEFRLVSGFKRNFYECGFSVGRISNLGLLIHMICSNNVEIIFR